MDCIQASRTSSLYYFEVFQINCNQSSISMRFIHKISRRQKGGFDLKLCMAYFVMLHDCCNDYAQIFIPLSAKKLIAWSNSSSHYFKFVAFQ